MCYRKRQVTLVTVLDLSQAFDRASIQAIIYTLTTLGVKGKVLQFLLNYMEGRSYRVWVQNKTSAFYPISSPVPQGSPLSPILFNILLSDFPQIKVKILIYADDITLNVTAETIQEAKKNARTH